MKLGIQMTKVAILIVSNYIYFFQVRDSLFVICKNEKSAYNRTDYGTPCEL